MTLDLCTIPGLADLLPPRPDGRPYSRPRLYELYRSLPPECKTAWGGRLYVHRDRLLAWLAAGGTASVR